MSTWNGLFLGEVVLHQEGYAWLCVGRASASAWGGGASLMLNLETGRVDRWDNPGSISSPAYHIVPKPKGNP